MLNFKPVSRRLTIFFVYLSASMTFIKCAGEYFGKLMLKKPFPKNMICDFCGFARYILRFL